MTTTKTVNIALVGESKTGKTTFIDRHVASYEGTAVDTGDTSIARVFINPKGDKFDVTFNFHEFRSGMIPIGVEQYSKYDAIFEFVSTSNPLSTDDIVEEIASTTNPNLADRHFVSVIRNYSSSRIALFGEPLENLEEKIRKTSCKWKRTMTSDYGPGWCISDYKGEEFNDHGEEYRELEEGVLSRLFRDNQISYFVFERDEDKTLRYTRNAHIIHSQFKTSPDPKWKTSAPVIADFCRHFASEIPIILVANKIDLHNPTDFKEYIKTGNYFDKTSSCAISAKTGYGFELPLVLCVRMLFRDPSIVCLLADFCQDQRAVNKNNSEEDNSPSKFSPQASISAADLSYHIESSNCEEEDSNECNEESSVSDQSDNDDGSIEIADPESSSQTNDDEDSDDSDVRIPVRLVSNCRLVSASGYW
jgi:GTPase SAR1 family protein